MKENQRVAVTKRMLKEGLLRLLETKPLDKIRVNELCRESGINRATFYRHYEAPQDVLLELEVDFAKQLFPQSQYPKTVADIQRFMESACTYVYEHADIAKILFCCNTDVDVLGRLNELYRHLWKLRSAEKAFSNADEDTARVVTALLGGGCYCLLRQWILEEIPKSPAEIAAIMCSMIHWPVLGDLLPAEG